MILAASFLLGFVGWFSAGVLGVWHEKRWPYCQKGEWWVSIIYGVGSLAFILLALLLASNL